MEIPTTLEGIVALSKEPPLTELVIGGIAHPVARLSDGDFNKLNEWAMSLNRKLKAGIPVAPSEFRLPMLFLLGAANPKIDFAALAPLLAPEHVQAAAHEWYRQAACRALLPSAMAGRA